MEYILETHNLEKKYKNFKAINDLNMHIEKGAIYGFIGKNGAGKTSLIRIICGLQKPNKGSYNLYGVLNTDKNIVKVRKRIGAIVETASIRQNETAMENLKEQSRIIGVPSFNNIEEILKFVGLLDTGKRKVKDFSLRNETKTRYCNDISRKSRLFDIR